jgi:hypothetical protein
VALGIAALSASSQRANMIRTEPERNANDVGEIVVRGRLVEGQKTIHLQAAFQAKLRRLCKGCVSRPSSAIYVTRF